MIITNEKIISLSKKEQNILYEAEMLLRALIDKGVLTADEEEIINKLYCIRKAPYHEVTVTDESLV